MTSNFFRFIFHKTEIPTFRDKKKQFNFAILKKKQFPQNQHLITKSKHLTIFFDIQPWFLSQNTKTACFLNQKSLLFFSLSVVAFGGFLTHKNTLEDDPQDQYIHSHFRVHFSSFILYVRTSRLGDRGITLQILLFRVSSKQEIIKDKRSRPGIV